MYSEMEEVFLYLEIHFEYQYVHKPFTQSTQYKSYHVKWTHNIIVLQFFTW